MQARNVFRRRRVARHSAANGFAEALRLQKGGYTSNEMRCGKGGKAVVGRGLNGPAECVIGGCEEMREKGGANELLR